FIILHDSDRELSASGSLSSTKRLHGACDACRKKKSDSANMPGNNCTNCQLSNIKCTHDIPRLPKKSETQAAYIQSLEEKVEKMLGLLQRAYPGQDIDLLLDLPPDEYPVPHSISKELRSSASPPSDIDDDTSEAEDLAHLALSEHFKQLSLDAVDDRFFGQSSKFRRPKFWNIQPDPSFGMTVLLVCAVASRYSNDPRVMMPGDTSGLSSGWRYSLLIKSASIYDLQYYALALLYLHGTSIPNTGWHVLGLGMRHALEKGAHRRKPNSQKPSAEEELMKRAFWCLVCIDRYMSSFLGRPCLMNDEDFDVDYPIECDDEYWETEDPEQAFKQPPGLPCTITGFVCALKLCEILAFTLRTLYSTKKSKILSGLIGNEWENRLVAELNSSLDKWKVSLPHFCE
ncbi:fungal-specific transcription factor domain-containing protein, partial [Flammula alnicola]